MGNDDPPGNCSPGTSRVSRAPLPAAPATTCAVGWSAARWEESGGHAHRHGLRAENKDLNPEILYTHNQLRMRSAAFVKS